MDEKTYVITDPAQTVIYGVAEGTSAQDALAGPVYGPWRAVIGREVHGDEIGAVAHAELLDGVWRELTPLGAQPHGDCGGDIQVSGSFSRRFARALPGGLWAVYSPVWYAINETVQDVDRDTKGEAIQRQTEYIVCDDLLDLDYVQWTDYRYTRQDGYDPDEQGALAAAQAFTAADIDWDGEPF